MEIKLNVQGMTCAACSARVEAVTTAVPGVESAEVNLLGGTMRVCSAVDCTADIILAVEKAGYHASISGQDNKESKRENESVCSEESSFLLLFCSP